MKLRTISKGFTLIELVMVIMIVGILSVVVGRTLLASLSVFTTAQNISDGDWQGFLAMSRFYNDVHTIRSANDIVTVSPGTFSFVDVSGNTVTYQLNGAALQRNGLTLAGNVSNLSFNYYNQNYSATATPSLVRYIAMAATVTHNNLSLSFSTMAGTRGMP